MFDKWLMAPLSELGMVVLSACVVYLAIIILTRIVGLRSFSKMSSFDFAMTVAVGTLAASTLLSSDPPLLRGLVALATVYALQKTVSFLRRATGLNKLIDNEPVLLMKDGEVLGENLRRTGVTPDDLRSKLREANVLERSQVRAVVFETTGDICVLHSNDPDVALEEWLLLGIQNPPQVEADPLAAN